MQVVPVKVVPVIVVPVIVVPVKMKIITKRMKQIMRKTMGKSDHASKRV